MDDEYDKKMPTDDPAAVVREVTQTQRAIIKDTHRREDSEPRTYYSYDQLACRVAKPFLRTSGLVQGSTRTV